MISKKTESHSYHCDYDVTSLEYNLLPDRTGVRKLTQVFYIPVGSVFFHAKKGHASRVPSPRFTTDFL